MREKPLFGSTLKPSLEGFNALKGIIGGNMDNYDIGVAYNSKNDTELLNMKGYRHDIFVKLNNLYFNLCAYEIVRLTQSYYGEIKSNGYYQIEPNLIIVKEVSNVEIVNTINYIYMSHYFEKIKPLPKDPDIEIFKIGAIIVEKLKPEQ